MKHICHWPGCTKEVPPRLWGCKPHWLRLPKVIRVGIWATYRPGQEQDKNPSEAYMRAARAAKDWAKSQEGATLGSVRCFYCLKTLSEAELSEAMECCKQAKRDLAHGRPQSFTFKKRRVRLRTRVRLKESVR